MGAFLYNFEIDVYPFWNNQAILEIELSDANAPIDFPPFLNIIREVTGEYDFKNSTLAENQGLDSEGNTLV